MPATPALRDLPNVPSLSLGTGLVTPLELTAAFAMFPNGGLACGRAASSGSWTPTGAWRSRTRRRAESVIAPQVAYQMVSMLQDVVDRGTASARPAHGRAFPVGRQDRHHR